MGDFTIGLVYTDREWRRALQTFVRDHVAGVAVRVLRDTRMALEEHMDVLVLDEGSSFLSAHFVEEMRDRNVSVVGVFSAEEPDGHGRRAFARLGVETVFPSTVEPDELLARLRELGPSVAPVIGRQVDEILSGVEVAAHASRGVVVVVGGPAGAGATEVAVALAQIASEKASTILVDLDEVSPGIARRLGLALYPHLLVALDELRGGGLAGPDFDHRLQNVLARPTSSRSRPIAFDVIGGLPDPKDWMSIPPDDVVGLLRTLAALREVVVVNVGPQLEDLSRWIPRYEASRSAVEAATVVVGVCEASPRGVVRFLDWLVDVKALRSGRSLEALVVNRAPRSRLRRAELAATISEHVGDLGGRLVVVPEDRAVAQSSWDGGLVSRRRPFLRLLRNLTGLMESQALATRSPGQ